MRTSWCGRLTYVGIVVLRNLRGSTRRLRQDDNRASAGRGFVALVDERDVDSDAVGRQVDLPDSARHVVHVTDVVELLDGEAQLPDPYAVAHPVGDQMDHPVGAHETVVIAFRLPQTRGRGLIPVHADRGVPRSEPILLIEARHALPVLVGQLES